MSQQPVRVLVVDDEERLRKVVVRVLRDAGIDADAAASGGVHANFVGVLGWCRLAQ